MSETAVLVMEQYAKYEQDRKDMVSSYRKRVGRANSHSRAI